jgi:AcrR family transcriptional regulator
VPRAGLSPLAVADLALAVVDDGGAAGWADLTLSAVAARAGVAVPSLYKHVDGLPALRLAVAARCVDEFTAVLGAAAAGHEGAEALWRVMSAARHYALAHPGRYRAVQGVEATRLGEQSARSVEVIAEVVQQLGAPPERWVDAVRTVRAAVHGFVELELAGGFGMPEDVDASFRYLVDTLVTGLATPR